MTTIEALRYSVKHGPKMDKRKIKVTSGSQYFGTNWCASYKHNDGTEYCVGHWDRKQAIDQLIEYVENRLED